MKEPKGCCHYRRGAAACHCRNQQVVARGQRDSAARGPHAAAPQPPACRSRLLFGDEIPCVCTPCAGATCADHTPP